jgi:hypothetical protein
VGRRSATKATAALSQGTVPEAPALQCKRTRYDALTQGEVVHEFSRFVRIDEGHDIAAIIRQHITKAYIIAKLKVAC